MPLLSGLEFGWSVRGLPWECFSLRWGQVAKCARIFQALNLYKKNPMDQDVSATVAIVWRICGFKKMVGR